MTTFYELKRINHTIDCKCKLNCWKTVLKFIDSLDVELEDHSLTSYIYYLKAKAAIRRSENSRIFRKKYLLQALNNLDALLDITPRHKNPKPHFRRLKCMLELRKGGHLKHKEILRMDSQFKDGIEVAIHLFENHNSFLWLEKEWTKCEQRIKKKR